MYCQNFANIDICCEGLAKFAQCEPNFEMLAFYNQQFAKFDRYTCDYQICQNSANISKGLQICPEIAKRLPEKLLH